MSGAELRKLREKAGLSRPMLAALSGLHPDTVKYWEAKPFVPGWDYGPSRMLAAPGQKVPERRSQSSLSKKVLSDTVTRARHGVRQNAQTLPGQKCGAKTRQGTPCQAKPVPGKRRCRLHGGLSTGPKGKRP